MEPGLLQAMVEVLDNRPEILAVVPDTKNIDDDGKVIGSMRRTLDLQSSDVLDRARQVMLASYQHVIAYGLLRASTLRLMRTRPDYVGWDPIFVWELALRGQLAHEEGPVLFRRWHAGSISRVKTVNEMRKWVEPNAQSGMNFPHWTWSYERARALMACPLSMRDRLRVGAFLLRAMSWDKGALVRDITQAVRRTLGLSDEYTF
jgi:hypothetical protein